MSFTAFSRSLLFLSLSISTLRSESPRVIRLATPDFQHNGIIKDFTYSRDGRFLITVGKSPEVRIWNARSGKLHQRISTSEKELQSVSLDDNGTLLAVVGKQRAHIWNFATGKLKWSKKTEFQFHTPAMISPNGTFFAAIEEVGEKKKYQLTIWDVDRDQVEGQVPIIGPGIGVMRFNPIRSLIAKLDSNGNVVIWNPWTKLDFGTYQKQRIPIQQFAWSPDGQRMVTANHQDDIQLWYVQDGKLLWDSLKVDSSKKERSFFSLLVISNRYCLTGNTNKLWLWDMKEKTRTKFLQFSSPSSDYSLRLAPDGKTIAMRDGTLVRLFRWTNRPDPETTELVQRVNDLPKERNQPFSIPDNAKSKVEVGHCSPVRRIVFLNQGKQLLSQEEEKKNPLLVWDTQTGNRILSKPKSSTTKASSIPEKWKQEFEQHVRSTTMLRNTFQKQYQQTKVLAVSKDGRMLAAINNTNHGLEIWETTTRKRRFIQTVNHKSWISLSFSPNGRFLAAVRDDGQLKLWYLCTGTTCWSSPMSMRMTCVQFSPDGNLLACGRENGQIELLNEPITVMRKEKAKTFALSPKQMQSHWEQLQNSNAKIAFVSMNKLILAHNQTIDFFTRQFKSIKFPTNNGKMNEPGTGKLFQNLRAIEVLERIGTNQAIQLLSHLAERSPTSLQSKAARDALQRFILP